MPIYPKKIPKKIPKIALLQTSLCPAASGWDFLGETLGGITYQQI